MSSANWIQLLFTLTNDLHLRHVTPLESDPKPIRLNQKTPSEPELSDQALMAYPVPIQLQEKLSLTLIVQDQAPSERNNNENNIYNKTTVTGSGQMDTGECRKEGISLRISSSFFPW